MWRNSAVATIRISSNVKFFTLFMAGPQASRCPAFDFHARDFPGLDVDRPMLLVRILQVGSACVRTAGHEKPLDSWVHSDLVHPSDGQLRVRPPQLAPGDDGQLKIPPQVDAARLSGSRPVVPLRFRPEDRLQPR